VQQSRKVPPLSATRPCDQGHGGLLPVHGYHPWSGPLRVHQTPDLVLHHSWRSLSGCSTKPSRILSSCGRLPICCLGAARWLGADADPGVGAVAAARVPGVGADADPGVGAVAAAGVAGVVADADDDPDGLGTTASTAAELSSSVSFIGGSECDGCCCEPPETTCKPHFSICWRLPALCCCSESCCN